MRSTIISLAATAILLGSATFAPALARDRSDRVQLTASQISDQAAARVAQLKADLRLTPEQEKNWSSVQTELINVWTRKGAHRQSWRDARANQVGSIDLIEQMRSSAENRIERGNDLKKLADASQPFYATLDDQQKKRFAEAVFHRYREYRDRRDD